MARCQCGGGGCQCVVVAGPNTTVDGSGSNANPYIIGAVTNCPEVRGCLSGGPNIDYDPATGVIGAVTNCDEVRGCLSGGPNIDYDPATGVIGAVTDCDEVRGCLSGGPNIDYDPATGVIGAVTNCDEVRSCLSAGPGVDYDPATGVISAVTDCEELRGCLSAGPGVDYDPATGVIGADISTAPGNNLVYDGDGLYVPTGAATVTTGCGIVGDGSAGAPVQASTGAWPYDCPVETAGSDVYCDPATGQLKAEPRTKTAFESNFETRTFANPAVPFPDDTPVTQFCADFTNPDPCRRSVVVITQETDVYFNLPAGAEAAAGQDTDEMWRIKNTGSTQMDFAHLQFSKLQRTVVDPGATITWCYDVTMARGSNGATYNQILSNIRFHAVSE